MKLASIRKLLSGEEAGSNAAEPCPCQSFCGGLLALAAGNAEAGTRVEWERLAAEWEGSDRQAAAGEFLARAKQLLDARNETKVSAATRQTENLQQAAALYQEALLSLAGHGERTVERLVKIQGALAEAVRMNGLIDVKRSITVTLSFVREQIEDEKRRAPDEMARLAVGHSAAREAMQRLLPRLRGREEAIAELERRAALPGARQEALVAASLERLSAVTERFTAGLTEELVHGFAARLGKQTEQLFRWSGATLVGMRRLESDVAALRTRLEESIGRTYEHWAFVNGRKVMLAQPVRWMCTALTGEPPPRLVSEVDRLEKGRLK